MTREEIKIIESSKLLGNLDLSKKEEEALEMAVDALENQTPTAYWQHVVDRTYQCTNCGYKRTFTHNFCEECGAKILGVKHGKEKE